MVWLKLYFKNILKFFFVGLMFTFLLIYYTNFKSLIDEDNIDIYDLKLKKIKHLIYTPTCHIPETFFSSHITHFFKKRPYFPCTDKPLLTYVELRGNQSFLQVDHGVLNKYSSLDVFCCYSSVKRAGDEKVKYSLCESFNDSVAVNADVIKVKCKDRNFKSIYENVHAIINPNMLKQNVSWKTDNIPPSVILVGIDSMSKMSLARNLPKSHSFLEINNFINLKGYTKIGENTFPNLIGILTGLTREEIYDRCNPAKYKLNNCGFIWDKFKELGFVTAYGEDETAIGTFNYQKAGFQRPPTDFYLRPYLLAAESLKSLKQNSMTICSGPENTGERITNFVKEFVKVYKNYPKFGLFWMNSFSHDNINLPSSMDDKILEFLQDIYKLSDNTILVFLSDHGFRFDEFRWTNAGWFEDKLPFIYIYVPNNFKQKYEAEYLNLLNNSHKLTNPFDVHMTLQHLLKISNAKYKVLPSRACPKCTSLFEPIDQKRTCKDAGISQQWCLCQEYLAINKNKPIVTQTANFIVSHINKIVQSEKEGKKCAYYYLKAVVSSLATYDHKTDHTPKYFIISLITVPHARFEATVQILKTSEIFPRFQIIGRIIRINRYGADTKCISSQLKEYCYCKGIITKTKTLMSRIINSF